MSTVETMLDEVEVLLNELREREELIYGNPRMDTEFTISAFKRWRNGQPL